MWQFPSPWGRVKKQERMAFHRGASFLITLDFLYLYRNLLGFYETRLGTIRAFTGLWRSKRTLGNCFLWKLFLSLRAPLWELCFIRMVCHTGPINCNNILGFSVHSSRSTSSVTMTVVWEILSDWMLYFLFQQTP